MATTRRAYDQAVKKTIEAPAMSREFREHQCNREYAVIAISLLFGMVLTMTGLPSWAVWLRPIGCWRL